MVFYLRKDARVLELVFAMVVGGPKFLIKQSIPAGENWRGKDVDYDHAIILNILYIQDTY